MENWAKLLNKKYKTKRIIPEKTAKRSGFYNQGNWHFLAKSFKMEHPLCLLCELEDRIEAATLVHHALKFLDLREENRLMLFLDKDNLVCLCSKCHQNVHKNAKELTEKQRNYLKNKKERLFLKYLQDGIIINLTSDELFDDLTDK